MKHNLEFEYGRIVLKPLEEVDIEELRVLRNKESQYFSSAIEILPEQQREWYKKYQFQTNDIMFKVVKKDKPEEFIGAIAVYDIDEQKHTAVVGRTVIDKIKAPEKGIGMEATKAVCKFAFEKLGTKKIVASVLKSNERIIKVDTRVGFKIVGDIDNDTYAIELTPETLNA